MATATSPTPPEAVKVTQPRPDPKYEWFTTCPEDWFILVVRGGDLRRIIHGMDDWTVDENFEFQEATQDNPRTYSPIRVMTGREFVGIPGIQGMFVYKFSWNKFWRSTEKDDETGELKDAPEYTAQTHESEYVYITPFENQYPLVFGGIEVIASDRKNDKEEVRIPITVVVTVRVRMKRPKTALMTNIDWFGQVLTPNIQKAVKEFAGNKKYDWMISNARTEGSEQFASEFMKTGENLSKFGKTILKNAGVEIIDIGITDIKPNKKFEEALLAQAAAERMARAKIADAEGEKQARILAGEAEKEYQRLVGEGNAARTLAEAEAELTRIQRTILSVTGGPGTTAAILEKWHQMRGSGLTTYVEGGGDRSGVGILVGANGRPISS